MLKKIAAAILLVLFVLCIIYWSLISYGIAQGLGQLKIIREARPVEEFIRDPAFPDSLKSKLRLIAQARKFAIDSLGLSDTDNYKSPGAGNYCTGARPEATQVLLLGIVPH